MRRPSKRERETTGDGGNGSGKDTGKDKRTSDMWIPVSLEKEFPAEFRYTSLLATALFVFILAIYVATMHPSVSGGDNGELLGCACELGIAHPPGYPTFTMLGFLFYKYFPFGKPAFRIGVMAAACDALAGVLVMLCVQRWVLFHEWNARCARHRLITGRSSSDNSPAKERARRETPLELEDNELVGTNWVGANWVGILGGGLYSLSPLVWLYSVQAEVFAMNNMFAALLLHLIIRYNEQRLPSTAYLGALCIGVGLTNQHTLLLFALPVVAWALSQDSFALCHPRHFGMLTYADVC